MGSRSRRRDKHWFTGKRLLACSLVGGVGMVAGWLASLNADPVQTSEVQVPELVTASVPAGSAAAAELSPAQIVAARFRPDPQPVTAAPAAGYALASVPNEDPPPARPLLSPYPAYAALSGASLPPQTIDDDASASETALAYAPADAGNGPAASAARSSAAATPPAVKHPVPPHPASASNTVLNNAQIASIRERLRLTSYQQQLWPPVEAALRDIAYRQVHNDASRKATYRGAAQPMPIDTASPEVQRLKSAAIPLIMSMNEDQKQEVRTMARLMGLEQLASQF